MKQKRYRIKRGEESYIIYGDSLEDALWIFKQITGMQEDFVKKNFKIERLY